MQCITYDDRGLSPWIDRGELERCNPSISQAEKLLASRSGPGSDFLGWLDLPTTITTEELDAIADAARKLRERADTLVCIGIGGSYLGARAALDFLGESFEESRSARVMFAGHTINSDYLVDMLSLLATRETAVNVISKSGTTTEPGIAFRVLREWMEKRYGTEETARRIVATTDPSSGALRALAQDKGYRSFAIPPDVGGRFSVLTPVGLFPIAFAGVDIHELVAGAREAIPWCSGEDFEANMAARYAAVRTIMLRRGKGIEVMASFQPQLHFISEWWKQLAGESEGKDQTGIFPAALDYTTDLHSLGQWMQEGVRSVFETFILLEKTRHSLAVPRFDDDGDGLNYLAGRTFEQINASAFRGTFLAHTDGGVPCATLTIKERSPRALGQTFYFFEKAIALSGYLLRVNPFDQPGVEAYKKNMFALLAKPGFESMAGSLDSRLQEMGQ